MNIFLAKIWEKANVYGAGIGLEKLMAEFDTAQDDYNSIMAKAIADRFAEAFAKCLHREVYTTHCGAI